LEFEITSIKTDYVASLVWEKGHLLDWKGGGRCYNLDGTSPERRGSYGYSYRFDSAQSLDDWVLLYEKRGTKAALIKDQKLDRQLNRDYYHADIYNYPIVFGTLFDDRSVVIHCPDAYDTLQIELLETGEVLTAREAKSDDIFHSNLTLSPNGRYLLDSGWVWQPWEIAAVYDLKEAVSDPLSLGGQGMELNLDGESEYDFQINGGAFLGKNKLFVNLWDEESESGHVFWSSIVDLETRELISMEPTLAGHSQWMPVGEDHVLGLSKTAQLLNVRTGVVEHEFGQWDLGFGTPDPSAGETVYPQIAADPENNRCAFGLKDKIEILKFKI